MRTISGDENYIISDLRFATEYHDVKKKNGFVYYIDRNGMPGAHPSEQETIILKDMNKFDDIIDNTGTLKDLFNQLKIKVYGKLRSKALC